MSVQRFFRASKNLFFGPRSKAPTTGGQPTVKVIQPQPPRLPPPPIQLIARSIDGTTKTIPLRNTAPLEEPKPPTPPKEPPLLKDDIIRARNLQVTGALQAIDLLRTPPGPAHITSAKRDASVTDTLDAQMVKSWFPLAKEYPVLMQWLALAKEYPLLWQLDSSAVARLLKTVREITPGKYGGTARDNVLGAVKGILIEELIEVTVIPKLNQPEGLALVGCRNRHLSFTPGPLVRDSVGVISDGVIWFRDEEGVLQIVAIIEAKSSHNGLDLLLKDKDRKQSAKGFEDLSESEQGRLLTRAQSQIQNVNFVKWRSAVESGEKGVPSKSPKPTKEEIRKLAISDYESASAIGQVDDVFSRLKSKPEGSGSPLISIQGVFSKLGTVYMDTTKVFVVTPDDVAESADCKKVIGKLRLKGYTVESFGVGMLTWELEAISTRILELGKFTTD